MAQVYDSRRLSTRSKVEVAQQILAACTDLPSHSVIADYSAPIPSRSPQNPPRCLICAIRTPCSTRRHLQSSIRRTAGGSLPNFFQPTDQGRSGAGPIATAHQRHRLISIKTCVGHIYYTSEFSLFSLFHCKNADASVWYPQFINKRNQLGAQIRKY